MKNHLDFYGISLYFGIYMTCCDLTWNKSQDRTGLSFLENTFFIFLQNI